MSKKTPDTNDEVKKPVKKSAPKKAARRRAA